MTLHTFDYRGQSVTALIEAIYYEASGGVDCERQEECVRVESVTVSGETLPMTDEERDVLEEELLESLQEARAAHYLEET